MNRSHARTLAALVLVGLACARAPEHAAAPSACAGASSPPSELGLERALPIDGPEGFEPSGLLLYGGRLLTVSDKHDDVVFELELGTDSAKAKPFLRFEPPEGSRPLDLEGLALDADAALLLASEAHGRVLRVASTGQASWQTPSLKEAGRKRGLFARPNAGIEGIAVLGQGRLVLAAERQPRGLIEVTGSEVTNVWPMNHSVCRPPRDRPVDFADLTTVDGTLYALARNAHVVVRLERQPTGYVEREIWSYEATENDPRFAYEDRSFGLAEGLAIDERRVFVVLDANRDRRRSDPDDFRALCVASSSP
jgi:hypothetical protein